MMETEMEVIRIDRGQNHATNILNSDELKIVSVSEGAQNVNDDDIDKIEENLDIEIPSFYLFDEDRRYTKEDLKYNFLASKLTAWLKMSPFGVDGNENENSSKIPRLRSSHEKWWQNGISYSWLLFASLRVLIMILSTAHFGMTGNTEENLGQMTMMIICTICGILLIFELLCLVSSAQNFTQFLLSIFKYLDADAEIELEKKETHPQKFWIGFGFGGHTLKELLIIILLPFVSYLTSGMIPLLIAVDPSFPLLLVSLVQPEISFSFLFLTAFDSVIFVYYYMVVHMVFYVFMGMHRITEEAGLTLKKLKTNSSSESTSTENEEEQSIKIQKALKNLGLLHIWTCFFNRSLSNVIYGAKLISLTTTILGGFGLIKMIQAENWPYVGVFFLLFFQGSFGYNVIFGRAFEIPEKVEELKREIRHQSFKTYKNNPFQRKYVEKYLRSIPWLGVKDGVYKMERMTCVNFLCFGVEHITDLVLTY